MLEGLHCLIGGDFFTPRPHTFQDESDISSEFFQGLPSHTAAQQLAPKVFLRQALQVVMLDLGPCQARLGTDPGVQQAQAMHPWISRFLAIEQGGRCAVAQPPQGNVVN